MSGIGGWKSLQIVFLLVLLNSGHVTASGHGAIEGRLVDNELGIPISYARVIIPGEKAGGMTLTDGSFKIVGIEPGTYSLMAVMPGYEDGLVDSIRVASGQSVEVEMSLTRIDTLEIADYTDGLPPYCEVYGAEKTVTIMSVSFDLKRPHSEYLTESEEALYNDARRRYFPHCDNDWCPRMHGEGILAIVYICPKCREARDKWLEEHRAIGDKISRNRLVY